MFLFVQKLHFFRVILVRFMAHHKAMNIFVVEMNFNLAAIYYNNGKPNLFRINVDVTLFNFKINLTKLTIVSSVMTQRRRSMLSIVVC